jgi:hypothetical protein
MTPLLVALVLLIQTSSLPKADIVSVTGCVAQGTGDTWVLTNATDPAPDERSAGGAGQRGASQPAPTTTAPPTATAPPPAGKNRYRLIGILELGIPDHKGHTVTLKGLLIPGTERKLNVTSVKMVAPSCAR